jgi:TonB family protein
MNRFLAFAKIGVGILSATTVGSLFGADTVTASQGDAAVQNWVTPVYPPELEAANVQGSETVNFIVNADGTSRDPVIAQADDHRFDASIIAAIAASKFTSALDEGRAIPQCVQLVWHYTLPYHPSSFVELKPLPKTPAEAVVQPATDYPTSMLARRLDGRVRCLLDINADGHVSAVRVEAATDGEFVPAALQALRSTHFVPAHQGTLAIADRKESVLPFTYDAALAPDERTVWQVNGLSAVAPADGSAAPNLPPILVLPEPVYPMAELLAGHSGDAEVTFTVNEQGIPETVTLDSASSPEFGKALVAATELSIFDSALKDGHSVNVTMHRAYHFAPPAENPETGESGEIKVERELRAGQAIRTAKGLDHPLRPIWQMAPRIPIAEAKTEHPNAKAQIEVIIDEDGRVRAPKVVSASSDALGYAAATAVAQWCFDPPTRNGEATQVRVIVPLVFK